jgi:3-deoxy-D-manno-octulosonate 8-phosphate phosphatase (KDO 8-P phosphatase)
LDAKDKIAGFETLLNRISRSADECLYVGDDVVDLPVIRRAGIGAAVANGVPELDEAAQWRTTASGGNGAAAEIVRRVLKEKGLYDKIMERYRR